VTTASGSPDLTTPSAPRRGRRVLLLVTGGIAAYKACTIVRRLVDNGCTVQVAMTEAAQRFVTPLTFEALSGRPVGTTLWGEGGEEPLDHIQWAQQCDLLLVAPATANFLAKMAVGIADDLASTLVTATDAPIVVAPAMNDRMWRNVPNQENLDRLRARGVEVIDPGSGYLACGTVAEGRLAEPEVVVARVLARLTEGPMQGWRVLITAGGTREPIDAVRWIGNHSTGRMGIALAEAARDLGAEVTLLLGPTEVRVPDRVDVHRFVSVDDLLKLLGVHAASARCVFMAAAVSDWRAKSGTTTTKLKKTEGLPTLELEATPDLLARLAEARTPGQLLVGFALETGDDDAVRTQARAKLERKRLDLICGNRADVAGEGFGGDTNRLFLYDRTGRGEWTASGTKRALADLVCHRLVALAAS
jgi:phosphopantothenoylcysteine decarboxylase / phosphopantothenate---cysteine ligase